MDKKLILKAVGGLAALLIFAGLTGLLLREPVTLAGEWLIGNFGLAGIFVGVLITDTSPIPMTHEPVLFLGITAGESFWRILAAGASASVLAGPVGWSCGRVARSNPRFRNWLYNKFPKLVDFMARHGAKGVAIAALLPIPFAVSTWLAGMSHVRFGPLLAASLLRIPKTAFYLWLLQVGWSVGG
jgi:membrane protein YqaA with SNARE-associated domain